MSKNEKEIYILKNQVHFGSLKTSVPKGTIVEMDREKRIVWFAGVEHSNINEIDMMIRAGYIIPYEKQEAPAEPEKPKAAEKPEPKMDVRKSDLDSMSKEIDISDTKSEVREKNRKAVKAAKMEVVREDEKVEESRGMSVIKNDAQQKQDVSYDADTDKQILKVVNGDDFERVAEIKPPAPTKGKFGLSTTEDAKDVAAAINGQEGTVVKKIGKSENTKSVVSGSKLTAKHASAESEAKAKAAADARKAASAARRSKKKETK